MIAVNKFKAILNIVYSQDIKFLFIVLILLFLPIFSFSITINVPADYSTIQNAIDVSTDGDEIIVSQGNYNEMINFKGKNIILRSTDPTDTNTVALTVIDANTSGTVVTFEGTELSTCTLSGFTIRNGNAEYGAGINCGFYPKVAYATIQNNVIMNNTASMYGGGIYSCRGLIQNNIIKDCYSVGGGAIASSQATIQSNEIFGNSSSSGGGALAGCSGVIKNNSIYNNTANKGGAIHSCSGVIQENIITENSAVQGGGFWLCEGIIQNNIITKNSAVMGGGIVQGRKAIYNNIIAENYASDYAGGLAYCSSAIIQNNIIFKNSAGKYGGGVTECNGPFLNNIIWENSAPRYSQIVDGVKPNYCCIMDWIGGGTDNITDNPMFIDSANGDFHLLDNSPCIDKGNPDAKYFDGCLPPGRGNALNDMGVYGGPYNCIFPIRITKEMLINYLLGKYTFSSAEYEKADFYLDNFVNIADLVYLINLTN